MLGAGELLAAVLLVAGDAEGVPEPDGLGDGVADGEGDGDGQTGLTATVRVIVVDGS